MKENMIKLSQSIVLLITVLFFTSCEKEISIDLNFASPQIVIEGVITDEPGPYFVNISRTVNFSDDNSYPPISNALVIISNSLGINDTLSEVSPGRYQTSKIVGQSGITYNLKVVTDSKEYYATSTMPQEVILDSLRFNPFSNPGSNDGYTTIPVYTDPASFGNNYRFIQTINGEKDNAYILSNDNINNGVVNQRPIFSPDAEIAIGDTVTIEMRCIDISTYNYFFTLSQIAGGRPGGGTTPTNPPNNITGNNALGLFAAYTTQTMARIAQ